MMIVLGKDYEYTIWNELVRYLLADVRDDVNCRTVFKNNTILTQALIAWEELDDLDDLVEGPFDLIGNGNEWRMALLRDVHAWITRSEHTSGLVMPVFSTEVELSTETITFLLYRTADQVRANSRFTPIARAVLMMALLQDPSVVNLLIEDIEPAAVNLTKLIMLHVDLEEYVELYYFVTLILESYSGDADAIRSVLADLEDGLLRFLCKSRGAIGHVRTPLRHRSD